MKYLESVLLKGETIRQVWKPMTWILLILALLILIVGLSIDEAFYKTIAFLIFIGLIIEFIRKFGAVLAFTDKRVIGKTGGLISAEFAYPLNKVQGVHLKQGKITIKTATDSYSFLVLSLSSEKPRNFVKALSQAIDDYEEEYKKQQQKELIKSLKEADE